MKPNYGINQRIKWIISYAENVGHDASNGRFNHLTKSDLKKIKQHISWIENRLEELNDTK